MWISRIVENYGDIHINCGKNPQLIHSDKARITTALKRLSTNPQCLLLLLLKL